MSKRKKFKKWFKRNVTSILDFFMLVFAIIAIYFYSNPKTIYSLIICMIVFTLSLLIKDFYSNNSYKLLKQIENSLNTQIKFNTIATKRESLEDEYFFKMLKDANNVFISGSSLIRVSSNIQKIINMIAPDCHIRLVIVSPNTQSAKFMATHIVNKSVEKYNKQINSSINLINEHLSSKEFLASHTTKKIEFHEVNCCPPLGFVSVHKHSETEEYSRIKAEIYSLSSNYPDRMNFICNKGDATYKFFENQIKELWDKSKPVKRNNSVSNK